MGLIDPNDGTLQIIPKPGEVRNPLGINGSPGVRRRNHEIRAALLAGLKEPCGIEGEEQKSYFEYGIRTLLLLWCAGDRWAVKFIADRCWGRVPFNIEMDVTHREELSNFSDEELLARMDAIRDALRDQIAGTRNAQSEVIDAEVAK